MPYGFKIELGGVDITDKVSSFEITASLESYVRELSIDLADPALYTSMDFNNLPAEPSIEVFTRITTEWISQGVFFIEKPTTTVGIHETVTGLWGRSVTALLGSPFAHKITTAWTSQTSFYGIAQELCDSCGLTWDPAYCDIDDFVIYSNTYSVEDAYPIEILNELAEAAGAVVTTDRLGHVCVRTLNYSPSAADATVSDPVTVQISEPIDFPDFGNRIKVSASGSVGGYDIDVTVPTPCLPRLAVRSEVVYALVRDDDGNALDGVPVTWSSESGLVNFAAEVTATGTVLIGPEEVKADDFYTVTVKFPVLSVVGVFARADEGLYTDLAGAGSTIDDRSIILASPLKYCDQTVRVYYRVEGVALNTITGGANAGTDTIYASIEGNKGEAEVYIQNPCECPMSLSMYAVPSSITVDEGSTVVAYAEVDGDAAAPGTAIFMTEPMNPKRGVLDWTRALLGWATIENEACYSINDYEGNSQCETKIHIMNVIGVYLRGENSDGEATPQGGNLYGGTFSGKRIDLSVSYPSGVELLVTYIAKGVAVNTFLGVSPGEAFIQSFLHNVTEEPLSAHVTIDVNAADEDDDPSSDEEPAGCCETTCDPTPAGDQRLLVDFFASGATGFLIAEHLTNLSSEGGGTVSDVGSDKGSYYVEVAALTGDGFAEGDVVSGDTSGSNAIVTSVEGTDGDTERAPIVCSENQVCCINATTMKRGCFHSSKCLEGSQKGGSGGSAGGQGKTATPTDTKGQCKRSDGTFVKCGEGMRCCKQFGLQDCYYHTDCEAADPSQCFTDNCMKTYGTEKANCLAGRFARGLQIGGDGCKCSSLCSNEANDYGTIQSYDGGSYRSFGELAQVLYGLTPGTAAYQEKKDALREEAIAQCLRECGECLLAGVPEIQGPTSVTKPGGYQYKTVGGLPPVTWSASGTGATISTSGFLTLASNACGSVNITAVDGCGQTATYSVQITNSGRWVLKEYLNLGYINACVVSPTYDPACGGPYFYFGGTRWGCYPASTHCCNRTDCDRPNGIPSSPSFRWFSYTGAPSFYCVAVYGCHDPATVDVWCYCEQVSVWNWEC